MEVTQPLHRALQLTPDREYTVAGDRVRTVAESADRVARLAGVLQRSGVADGDRVAIVSLNSDIFHESLLGIPWAGGVVVPVNYRWSAAEIAHSFAECDIATLIVDDTWLDLVESVRPLAPGLRTLIHFGEKPTPDGMLRYEDLIASAAPAEDARRGGADIFGIFYTGGTTGVPKGVVLTHDNMMTSGFGCVASGEFLTPEGRLLHVAPMFHLADIASWIGGLILNSTHVFVPAFTPAGVLDTMEKQRGTDVLVVPTMLQMMVDLPGAGDRDLSSMKHIVYGASPISEALLDRAALLFPQATFLQAYGMSELAPVATMLLSVDHHHPVRRRSAGRAGWHTEVRVVDENDVELPRGSVGEIVARGGATMVGYWKKPAETAEALRGGWMHTGDGGYMDEDGYVYVVDRIKDMIITGGENVYSVEVENVVAKHPAVAAVAIIGLPDERWGERVHAVIVLQPGQEVTLEEIQAVAREHIAGYKIPRSMSFLDALPLSAQGKVLKRELRLREYEPVGA
ncbi:Acyl-CoA synthetase (AMP-forming)/AMP-acid ligase II [Microbacterium sp. cf046]|uniref:long-chain-fatty-acid--CoA ligase n=1 Tax=Microbacterium sp. cf046 TaxID=1761803 RepID=UPI0008E58831|nr:long-chain-fatty-acid--CoA ligase [Microbacterium sp. cf046]SFS14592.1 Acyl-CoA synthetase (AMP-forming)/AMP-acid ligase II [Microbacterium sp. cf046]